ncbi:MAG: TRAP transporter substrate-binding protein DctP [Bdellovibrionales bacterium]|nr:TRAP transporter substrate-binding protein DctP [Bdellovibrionales bacterium]
MKTRREFIKKASAGALLGSGLLASCTKKSSSGPAIQTGQVLKWKLCTTWPKNFPALGTGANFLAEQIQSLSGGRIEVSVYGDGELVPALGVFDAVSRGTAELGHAASYYWKGKHEATQFFAAVPFGLNAQEMNAWLQFGGGLQLWDELYASFNLKPFPAGNTGTQMGGWFRKDIGTVSDFKGLKMRIPGLGGEVLRELGATVVTLPGGEIFQSLQSGAIDATEWIGPYNDLAFGLHKAASNYYWPGWQEPGATLECFVNREAYEALPSDLKAIVATACEATNMRILSEFSARNNEALQTLVQKHNVKLKRFSDQIIKALAKVSNNIVTDIAAKDSFSKKVFASFDKFRKQSIAWGNVAEGGISQARTLVF